MRDILISKKIIITNKKKSEFPSELIIRTKHGHISFLGVRKCGLKNY